MLYGEYLKVMIVLLSWLPHTGLTRNNGTKLSPGENNEQKDYQDDS